eukprot:TRINITY_DN5083_c0_g1_i7.p1 TRINITY_DN5083_c0_g1~~TRINITY_DN5083_c0_g1_i7.p1  ORF type:complete len:336 (-),score=51.94 TRINITY_DN5083_c0_g1_i7:22-933(-)
MERDIPERYLMRLGRGQEDLQSDKDFSKFGRVNYMLERRLKLLEDVSELADSFDMADDVAYTCETAGHFFFSHVLSRWEKFHMEYKNACKECAGDSEDEQEKKKIAAIHREFPFNKYFTRNAEGDSVFKGESAEEDMEIAESCMKNLRQMFLTLEETRPFELLRTFKDRGNFLITKHAKVIAMTCTHAAIKRGDLVKLHFMFDNLIMEEAAQILEIETFIPMLLQQDDPESGSRLKRVVLLGDHHQLPPVIKNRAFQKYSHMDQSLFTRFVRLGMPYIQLNAQEIGRAVQQECRDRSRMPSSA